MQTQSPGGAENIGVKDKVAFLFFFLVLLGIESRGFALSYNSKLFKIFYIDTGCP